MPASEQELLAVLRPMLAEADSTVVEFLASALQEVDGEEELQEVCEPWLASASDSDALLASLRSLLGIGKAAATAPAAGKVKQSAAPGAQKPLGAMLKVDASSQEAPSTKSPSDSGEEAQHKKAKPKLKGSTAKAKKHATSTDAAAAADGAVSVPAADDLMEVTAEVSRFHKEAVQDEITSTLDIDVKGLCISVAGRELLVEAHLKLCPGQRYGLIGRNGCGKSSLLRAMDQRRIPGFPENSCCLLVAQEDIGDERSAVATVLAANEELATLQAEEAALAPAESTEDPKAASKALCALKLLRRRRECERAARYESKLSGLRGKEARKALLEAQAQVEQAEKALAAAEAAAEGDAGASLEATTELAEVRARLSLLDPASMEAQIVMLLQGLGFKPSDLKAPTKMLSGGWRMRVAIARALFAKPNVLMLDEPTNHLDWEAILWLERYLKSSAMEDVALIVVSHDRDFLDNTSTMIMRIHDRQLFFHEGNYSTFEKAHEEDQLHRADLAQRVQEKRDKVEKQVAQMEQKGRKSNNANLLKQVASRRTKLGMDGKPWSFNRVGLEGVGGHKFKASYGDADAAEAAMVTESREADVKLRLKSAAALGFEAALLQCRDVVVGYDAKQPLIRKFDLDIRSGSRVAILGVNGSGKTTLLRTLAQDLAPLSGEVYQQPRVVVGFFNQHQTDALPQSQTPLEVLQERFPELAESEVRSHLGSFGIGRQAVQPVHSLSGGEKCRVALAAITLRPPHVLLLDEPTNHLDLPTVEALGRALKDFDGAVLISSHDRRLLREVCTDYFAVQGRQLAKLKGLDDFLRSMRSSGSGLQ
mmetsp:Transcript_69537/g.166727  ORF Transcript_69537/g.166727 Transcript_69537/m.166727 type:complete len:821 (-) Transcript_69537:369-2831(-)|eukprot:CAMPEP_0178401612 /NCGR_PEP_ID=MMETSP0689_2-20121128/16393_1 /TAXON_ID=160604 /ORGANISM="Amphidinium massartii, Strain CS-259" /LENGTH=820 /DNA_ID=CAMNT_0020022441 /DNA_START=84 /DNA_END=2546 /DNA_ORIENTATION=-